MHVSSQIPPLAWYVNNYIISHCVFLLYLAALLLEQYIINDLLFQLGISYLIKLDLA